MGFFALSEFYGGSCIVLVVIWRELQEIVGNTSELFSQTPVVPPQSSWRNTSHHTAGLQQEIMLRLMTCNPCMHACSCHLLSM